MGKTTRTVPSDQDRLVRLSRFVQETNLARSEEEVFQVAAEHTAQILQTDRASIALIDDSGCFCDIVALDGDAGAIPLGKKIPIPGTMVGETIHSKGVLIVDDAAESKYADLKMLVQFGRAFMDAPLISGGSVLGTLNAMRVPANSFSEEDAETIGHVAAILASNISARRLFKSLQSRLVDIRGQADLQKRLYELAASLHTARTEEDVGRLVTETVKDMIGVDRVSLGLMNPDASTMTISTAAGHQGSAPAGFVVPLQGTGMGLVVERRQTVHFDDLSSPQFR